MYLHSSGNSNVIWVADTNYRVDLDYNTAKALAEADDFETLFAVDQVCGLYDVILTNIDCQQLRQAMDTGASFAGYTEGPLLFRPTYRYDAGTDHYDTSDKMRIPAWTGKQLCGGVGFDPHFMTDRILYHGNQLDLSVYSRSELRGSDHKPGFDFLLNSCFTCCSKLPLVFAFFRAQVLIIDAVKRATLSRLLLDNIISTAPGEKLDEKLAGLVFPVDYTECLSLYLPRTISFTS